ncbi:MAG: 4Fe-4S dicluster domain-containing protein, partial [Acidobacteria bacterium]|nr:4Fe-4S dicluster domain-containing protein [Acidobacteriota bacterium]
FRNLMPLIIGLIVSAITFFTINWWGFLVIFPYIGFSITVGSFIRSALKGKNKILGRKVSILMIMPCLLFFVPVVNRENFQLEGVALLILIGFLGKGVIHYAIAKIFGPLIWGRGFCGWACWTAAILDWLPVKGEKKKIPHNVKHLRWLALAVSLALPICLVFFLNFDVKRNYLNRQEMLWMFLGNAIYYLIAIPLAFYFKDRRAFCKIACPVSLVMKPTASLAMIKIKPTGKKCKECGLCNKICPMDVDVMNFVKRGRKITDTECILCEDCGTVCPVGAI